VQSRCIRIRMLHQLLQRQDLGSQQRVNVAVQRLSVKRWELRAPCPSGDVVQGLVPVSHAHKGLF
jgi:hypothetical protein